MIYDDSRDMREHLAIQRSTDGYNSRKMCSQCKQSRPSLGGLNKSRPHSIRTDWVCDQCNDKNNEGI